MDKQRKAEERMKTYHRALSLFIISGTFISVTVASSEESPDDSSLWNRSSLLGDPGDYRSKMEKQGIVPEINYLSTMMSNVSGGLDKGSAYKGNLKVGLDANLDTLFGLRGGRAFFSAFNHHGNSLSRAEIGDSLGNRKDDVEDSTHLFEFGYEQSLFQNYLSIKLGQIAVSSDFFGSASGFFIHDSFNWQPNGQSGAPAGPDSALGARLRWDITQEVYLQAAVYDNGTSGGFGDDRNDKHGTKWSVPHGNRAVWFFETGFVPSTEDHANWPTLKLGGWLNQANSPDLTSARTHDSNWGVYVIGEKTLWTEEENSDQGIRFFTRFNWSDSDINQLEWEVNTGLLYTGLFPDRDEDVFGIGFTHAEVSDDWAKSKMTGSSEAALELKYRVKISPWWNVEPFAQYIIHPGRPSGRDLNDAFVLGVVSQIAF